MSKEWLNEKVRNAAFAIGVRTFAKGLHPEALPLYQDMVRKISTGERIVISELTELLHGYNVHHTGVEHLQDLFGKPFILVTNHFHGGPLRGFWQVIAINHSVRDTTGQEPRWVQGSGSGIVKDIHDMVASATNNIVVGGVAGVIEIERTLHRKMPVAIHPEGAPSIKLQRGDYRAGRILLHAAKRDIPILTSAVWSENSNLFVNMGNILPSQRICEIGSDIDDARASGQHVVDHVMGVIAQHLPLPLRGYYG